MKKTLKWLLMLIFIFIIGVSVVVAVYLHKSEDALKNIHTGNASVSAKIEQKKPFSILLLGTDTGADGRTRKGLSDTIMIITLNPQKNKTLIYSVPRDSLAHIMDSSYQNNIQKINAAYSIGGEKIAKKTVSDFLNIPLTYTVSINMGALEEAVDFVGGVTVKTKIDVSYDGITIKRGTHHINGKEALTFVRMRYDDPQGDYGRQLRQQQVLKQVMRKLEKPSLVLKIPTLIEKLGNNVSTDLTENQIKDILENYRNCGKNIQSRQIIGKNAWINGSSYQVISTKNLQNASSEIRTSLNLPYEKIQNLETKLNEQNSSFFSDINYDTYYTGGYDSTYYK